ncbi:MAG TPA: nitronate monooxygenase [Candidatus Binataceae bacterium]|nr:nitronate monooxygenase [Candidatus Binataceae bacterium]
MMLKTQICELFAIDYPIISAGMGAVALAELAAAVSEAGGLGTVGLAAFGPEGILNEMASARRQTAKPLAANLLVPFLRPGIVEAVVQTPIQVLTFFWGDARDQMDSIRLVHHAGIKVMWQCGSAEEACWAKEAGVDAVMAQGFEAGGHVRGTTTSLALIPEVRDAIGDLPMVAAGGFADGRGLAAALALGADGAVFGTRFAASAEAAIHPRYRERILQANARDTVHTTLFDVGWPDAPHRVVRTEVIDRWEAAGRPPSGQRPREGVTIAKSRRPDSALPLVSYTVMPPADYLDGAVDELPFYAGQSCTLVREVLPASETFRRIAEEASDVITERLAALIR